MNKDFKVNIDKKALLKVLRRVKPLIPEIRICFNDDGIHVREVDYGHVCMYDATILKKFSLNKDVVFCVDVEKFETVLSLVKNNDVTLEFDGKLVVDKNYKISLLEMPKENELKIPNLKFDVEVTLDSLQRIKRIISTNVNDYLTLQVDKNKTCWVDFKSDEVEIHEPLGKAQMLSKEVNYPVTAMYSIDYFKNIIHDLDTAIFRFSTDVPIQVVEEKDNEKHLFLLAPRIDG